MKIVNCDCGESFWLNERGWPATCDLCGEKLEHKPLKEKEASSSVPFNEVLYFALIKGEYHG